MQYSALTLALCTLALFSCGAARRTVPVEIASMAEVQDVSSNTLIIMYDTEVGKEPLQKAIAQYEAEIIYDYSIIPGMAIRIPEGKDIKDAIAFFKNVKGVTSVERDHIYHLTDPVKPKLDVI